MFSIVSAENYNPATVRQSFHSSASSPHVLIFFSFVDNQTDKCEVTPQFVHRFAHFLNIRDFGHLFKYLLAISLEKWLLRSFVHYSIRLCF